MDNNKEQVKIVKSVLTKQVEDGMKKKELAAYYQISELAMSRILKEAGLTIRKFHINKPILIDDTQDSVEETTTQHEIEESRVGVEVDNTPKTFAQEVAETEDYHVEGAPVNTTNESNTWTA